MANTKSMAISGRIPMIIGILLIDIRKKFMNMMAVMRLGDNVFEKIMPSRLQ